MTTEEFVSRLERAKRSSKGWTARCPAHDDKSPSLSVADGHDGGTVVHCQAGCTFEAVCAAVGINPLDLAPPRPTPLREIACTYDYTDEDGNLLFQAVRYKHKGFSQRQPSGDGWRWDLRGARRVLYRLPSILQSSRAVWVVEGEKDADALVGLGFEATCNPMGAGKWDDSYSDSLKHVPWVLIVPDCDQAGRDHAQSVAASLHETKVPVKVLDLGRDDGYDPYDFIIEHGDQAADKLRELARTTPGWRPDQRPKLPIQSASTFLANVPPYDQNKDYLGPLLHAGSRVHVGGPIGHGKTSFKFEAIGAALRGDEFLGFKGKGGLQALYVDLEMPAEALGQAIRDARLEGVDGFSLLHLPDGLRIDTHPEDRDLLERAAEGFDLLVIDPFYKLMEQEMEYSASRAINACLDGIRARHPNLCTIVGFHAQEPMTPKQPLGMGSFSGFKVFHRACDISVMLQRIEGDTSRLTWLKDRFGHLGVKHHEHWTLEWVRGSGFSRAEPVTVRNVESEDAEFLRLFG